MAATEILGPFSQINAPIALATVADDSWTYNFIRDDKLCMDWNAFVDQTQAQRPATLNGDKKGMLFVKMDGSGKWALFFAEEGSEDDNYEKDSTVTTSF